MTDALTDQPPKSRSGKPALAVAVAAANLAGSILRDRLHTSKQVSFKGRADIVTDVDVAAENAVLGLLKEEYPEFGILAEESSPSRPPLLTPGWWTPWMARGTTLTHFPLLHCNRPVL